MFNRNELKIKDKVWYEAGFPDIQPGTIKDRRVLYNQNGSSYVEYKLTFWSSRGFYRAGTWIPAKWVIGLRD